MSEETVAERRGGPLRALYATMMRNAQGKHAWAALAVFAFAEASFFPIPPDVMLLPMMLADRKRAWQLAGWCALWSVIGGMAGYAIGLWFWDTAGLWIVNMLHVPLERVEAIRQEYVANSYLIAVQGLTPIPFKLVTISAGLANVPFVAFVFFAALARTVRFVVIEGLLVYWFGAQAKAILDKYTGYALVIFLIAVVAGIMLVVLAA